MLIPWFYCQYEIPESRQVDKVRSKRGKVTRSSDFKLKNEVKQHLEAVDTETMPLDLQTNFLSESVRKYLELGRAIPGIVTLLYFLFLLLFPLPFLLLLFCYYFKECQITKQTKIYVYVAQKNSEQKIKLTINYRTCFVVLIFS